MACGRSSPSPRLGRLARRSSGSVVGWCHHPAQRHATRGGYLSAVRTKRAPCLLDPPDNPECVQQVQQHFSPDAVPQPVAPRPVALLASRRPRAPRSRRVLAILGLKPPPACASSGALVEEMSIHDVLRTSRGFPMSERTRKRRNAVGDTYCKGSRPGHARRRARRDQATPSRRRPHDRKAPTPRARLARRCRRACGRRSPRRRSRCQQTTEAVHQPARAAAAARRCRSFGAAARSRGSAHCCSSRLPIAETTSGGRQCTQRRPRTRARPLSTQMSPTGGSEISRTESESRGARSSVAGAAILVPGFEAPAWVPYRHETR